MRNTREWGDKNLLQQMTSNDLQVGQTLVRVIRPWGTGSTAIRLVRYTVVKILKTRLLLQEEGKPEAPVCRILLRKRWNLDEYEVTQHEEGQSTYGGATWDLYSEDDDRLPEFVRIAAEHVLRESTRKALRIAEENLTPAKAQAAIKALQQYLAAHPAD